MKKKKKKRTLGAGHGKPKPKRPPRPQPHPHDGIHRRPHKPIQRPPHKKHKLSEFDRLIAAHPILQSAIVWRAPGPPEEVNGVPTPYSQWTKAEQAELAATVGDIVKGRPLGLSATPAVGLTLHTAGDLFSTTLTPALAWKYFLGYVAQSLAVEQQGAVSWSFDDYAAGQLLWLFDSKSLFHYTSAGGVYFLPKEHSSLESEGAVQPGDPVRIAAAARAVGLPAPTRRETVERLLDWCRANLAHFYGAETPDNLNDHWGYSGWPPVERVFAGTTHPIYGFAHWTAGCWGTAGFLRNVLRTFNIAGSLETADGHALPRFRMPGSGSTGMSRDLFLSHGDDPYNSLWRATPPVPIGELPIDATTYAAWFGGGGPVPPGGTNVARQTVELAIRYLSDPLLRAHCDDLAAGRGHAQSRVFDPQFTGLGLYYTVLELENLGLWTSLDAKLAAIGGCANVPP